MSKYEPLARYLANQPAQELSLTFEEIETIIGSKLPPSTYEYRALWSNNPQGHVMAQAWLKAGWETSKVEMEGRKLVFRRIRNPPQPDSGFSEPSPPPLEPGQHTLTVAGLDGLTMSRLKAKAELHGRSIADMARDILARGAALTPDERLALADRTRAMSPGLHDVDMVAMIREDRDSR
jgi:plasmid stability protein